MVPSFRSLGSVARAGAAALALAVAAAPAWSQAKEQYFPL